MSLNFGYLIAAAILFAILSILVLVQVRGSEFRPLLFWTAIVTSTMFGTAMADLSIAYWVSASPAARFSF